MPTVVADRNIATIEQTFLTYKGIHSTPDTTIVKVQAVVEKGKSIRPILTLAINLVPGVEASIDAWAREHLNLEENRSLFENIQPPPEE